MKKLYFAFLFFLSVILSACIDVVPDYLDTVSFNFSEGKEKYSAGEKISVDMSGTISPDDYTSVMVDIDLVKINSNGSTTDVEIKDLESNYNVSYNKICINYDNSNELEKLTSVPLNFGFSLENSGNYELRIYVAAYTDVVYFWSVHNCKLYFTIE